MQPVTIISLNTYLISHRFNGGRLTQPEKRASLIRSFVGANRPTLAFFQEVWGSGLPELIRGCGSDGASLKSHGAPCVTVQYGIPPLRSPLWVGAGTLAETLNTLKLGLLRTGGLFDLHDVSTSRCLYRAKHTFTVSRSRSKKGVEATMWRLDAWEGRSLLVFNTHLDPRHVENRRRQMDEISVFVSRTLRLLEDEGHDLRSTGMLVVGDFNIKAGTEEYFDVFFGRHRKDDGWNDLLLEGRGTDGTEDPARRDTYASTNSLIAHPDDCGRIDYAFTVARFGRHRLLPLRCVGSTIVRQPAGWELSDHYPLIFRLVPESRTVARYP